MNAPNFRSSNLIPLPPRREAGGAHRRPPHPLPAVLTLLALAVLTSIFVNRALGPDRSGTFPYPWTARWIAPPTTGEATTCFRKTVTITGPAEAAYIAVSADNFYRLHVNGKQVRPFYRPERFRTWITEHSLFNSLGYPRNAVRARIYSIAPLLKPGKNVIAIKVQSDKKSPRLAVEGRILTAVTDTAIRSDASWRCHPIEERFDDTVWTEERFPEQRWAAAVPQEPVTIPVDGPAEPFERRLRGTFVSTPEDESGRDVRFRAVFQLDRNATGGWLRLSGDTDCDLFLDGIPLTNAAWNGRYSEQPALPTTDPDYAPLPRWLDTDLTRAYLPQMARPTTDVFALQGALKAGRHVLEAVVHPRLPVTPGQAQAPPILHLEGALSGPNLAADLGPLSWEYWSGATAGWKPGVSSGAIGRRFAERTVWRSPGISDPSPFSEPAAIALGSLELWVLLLLMPFLFRPPTSSSIGIRSLRSTWQRWIPQVAARGFAPLILLLGALFVTDFVAPFAPDLGPIRPVHAQYALLLAVLGGVIASVAPDLTKKRRRSALTTSRFRRHRYAIALGLITLTATVLYTVHLGVDGHVADEYVSIYAADSVRHYGIPIYPNTDIVYTRSSLYHYVLAIFEQIGGGVRNPFSTRLLAGLYQIGTILVAYALGVRLAGRRAGLLAALFVAFSPYTVFYARYARFYSQFLFYTTLLFLFLLQSVRNPNHPWYRPAAILAFCGAYLSQQFALATIPSAVAIVLLSGQIHTWFHRRMIPWFGVGILTVVLDFIAYKRYSVTPRPFIDVETVQLLALHTDLPEVLPGMLFLGTERSQSLIGILYLLGFVAYVLPSMVRSRRRRPGQAVRSRWDWFSYLYLASAPTIFLTALLAPRPAARYIEHTAALAAVTAACTAVRLASDLRRWCWRWGENTALARSIVPIFGMTVFSILLLTFRPWRVVATLQRNITINNTDAARYIAAHRRPGDAVIFRSPEIAMVELGSCEYAWRPKRGSIFMYLDENRRLRERDSGAVMIDNVDKMRRAMQENERLWLVIPAIDVISPGTPQGAEMVAFVKANFTTVREPMGVQLLLWDRSAGRWRDIPHHGYDEMGF
ncbi:MAG: glycosyltransferase family 39 protein [Capsulimonadales bacterium]|nr:glycosyltransferase family 39 protein [Capsulimonadales bacterium]